MNHAHPSSQAASTKSPSHQAWDTSSRRIVWLLAAPPLAAVVAGFSMLALALAYPDPVLPKDPKATTVSSASLPAQTGRNHAATSAAGTRAQTQQHMQAQRQTP